MRLLIIGSGQFSKRRGGGEVYVRSLVSGLKSNNHQVFYFSIGFGEAGKPELKRVDSSLPEEYQFVLPRHWIVHEEFREMLLQSLADSFLQINPDVIHAHGWKCETSVAARKAGIPCVITVHHGGFVCPAGALLNAEDEICTIPASDVDCLKCCTRSVPGWKFWYQILRCFPLKARLELGKEISRLPSLPFLTPLGQMSWMIREKRMAVTDIGSAATRIIAPSPAMAESLFLNGVPKDKVSVVPHGIPIMPRFPLNEKRGSNLIRFVYIGRIDYAKGLHVLLEACRGLAVQSCELHIVGGAGTRRELRYQQRLRRKYCTSNVVWHGDLDSGEVMEMLIRCDMMVHPAICLEVFGLSIAEALSIGRPVIATRCGGAEIQVRDGENGFLVPPNDPAALRMAMQKVIDDRGLLADMAKRTGNVRSIDAHVREMEKIYLECLL